MELQVLEMELVEEMGGLLPNQLWWKVIDGNPPPPPFLRGRSFIRIRWDIDSSTLIPSCFPSLPGCTVEPSSTDGCQHEERAEVDQSSDRRRATRDRAVRGERAAQETR